MSEKGKENFEEFNCDCNPFRPPSQLPYPAVAGQVLLTKSDFTLPPRPDLLEWKDIEAVIGVADIKLTFTNNDAVAHIWKLINNVWVEVGAIGQITPEEAIKLQSIEYIQYIVLEDESTHKLKLMGKKTEEGSYEDISTVNFVNYNDYAAFKTTTQGDIIGIETLLAEVQATVETHGEEITSLNETIETIEANLAVINPIINTLRQATNPGKVLVKSSDGASIEWKVLASIQGITLELDTVTNTLKLYQNNGGVEQLVGQWDNINRNEITSITNTLTPIANSLNQAGEAGEILAKTSDGIHYNWKAITEIITGSVTTDTTDSNYWKVSIKLNNATFIDFVVPKKTLLDSILSDITEIEDNIAYLQEEAERLETAKQDKLTAGTNIEITSANVINANFTETEVDNETIEFTEDDKLKVKHDDTLIVGANGLRVATDSMSIGHNDDEQLEVIYDESKGLVVGDAGLMAKIDNSSIKFNAGTMAVNYDISKGLDVNVETGLAVKVDNSSIKFNENGDLYTEGGGSVEVDNYSIEYDDDGKLKLKNDETLVISENYGVGVKFDNQTIESLNGGYLAVNYDESKGLNVGDALQVKVDNSSIKFNEDGELYTEAGGSVEVDNHSIEYNEDGKLKVKNDDTLQISDSHGLGVNYDGSTIASNTSGQVAVVYNQAKGLIVGTGLEVNPDNLTINFTSSGNLSQRLINLSASYSKNIIFNHDNLVDTAYIYFDLSDATAAYMLINLDFMLKFQANIAGISELTILFYGDAYEQGLIFMDKMKPDILVRQNEAYAVISETILIPAPIYLGWASYVRFQVIEYNDYFVQPTIERNNSKITFL